MVTLFVDKDDYVWVGKNDGTTYQFEIDTVYERIWYEGKLIVNETDTFAMSGFQKGGNYPSHIGTPRSRDTFYYSIHFRTNANRDTLISKDYKSTTDSIIVKRNNYVDVPEGVFFIRKEKNKNN